MSTWTKKLLALAVVSVLAIAYIFPTVANLDVEKTKYPIKKKVTLGLDLQGGLYMVFGVDTNQVYREVLLRQTDALKKTLAEQNINVQVRALPVAEQVEGDPKVEVAFDAKSRDAIYQKLKSTYTLLRMVDDKPGVMGLGLTREQRSEIKENTLSQSIQVIRNRIDEFGVTEPAISSQGENRIVVELPGIKEVERAKQLVGRTAKLEFRIVNDKAMGPSELAQLVSKIETENNIKYKEGDRFSDYVAKINQFARGKIPADSEILFEREQNKQGVALGRVPYLIFTKAEVTGQDLQDARVGFDQENQTPIVSFELNPVGAQTFDKVTGEHLRERLAIVLDNIVHSAPVIQSRIGGGRGQITLGRGGEQNDIMREAKDLAIVLRAGALPAQLELLEQRVIGPTLGQDSIKRGVTAGLVGCLLVFVFMIFYYRASGAVAVLSLILNGIFAFAILIGLDATLTLPGIAGLALTIGMAVDSNVIIFERIRDELEEGKAAAIAIQTGFQKAFSSIFDANITHGIVAIVLMNFGTGPIKGFAVTLLVGIVTTLFTAVTVCKMIFDAYVASKNGQIENLSI